jgi:hypothetical protein
MKAKIVLVLAGLLLFLKVNSQTVYITNTGEKYHRGTCHYLSKSKNAIELQEAINQGYGACKICKPPQTVSKKAEVKEDKVSKPGNNATSSQCSATTQKGSRCKRMTTSSNGKCWQHGGN